MASRSFTIPSLVQGVSQQSAALRAPTQAELQINGVPSLVEGLQKRPPVEFQAKLSDAELSSAKIHFANRDASERYIYVLTDGDLAIYDKVTGASQTVNFPDGKTYLDVTDPRTDFRLVTVADYTFVVNRTVTVAMDATLSPTRDFQALVSVKQGDYGTRYVIYVNGTEVANTFTDDTTVEHTRTDWIADQLVNGGHVNTSKNLTTQLGAGWTVTRYGSAILIEKNDGSTFTISSWDSRSDDALTVATDKVQRFTDLPAEAPDGYVVEVVGDQTNNFDNYYVKFTAEDTNVSLSKGTWTETIKPGIKYAFNAATMPHVIISNGGGVFTFQKATWDNRLVGDETSAPEPSFVGHTLNGVSFSNNRLVLLADDNAILSGAGGSSYFRFWRATAKAILDDDPIDISAAHTKVAVLYHALAFDRQLILFSDQSQWALEGGQILSPVNVSMKLLSEYQASADAVPAGAGSVVLFATNRGGYSAIQEMEVVQDNGRVAASNVSDHVPKYIPANLHTLTASTSENILVGVTLNNSGVFYVHHWHNSVTSTGRLVRSQSAWHKFSITGAEVLAAEFFESELAVVYTYNGKTLLGKIQLDPGRVDTNQAFINLLDHRLTEAGCSSVTYDAGADETTVTTPIPLTDPVFVGRGADAGDLIHEGSGTGTSWVIPGDYSAATFHVGSRYTFTYRFSEQVMRTAGSNGAEVPVTGGRLQLRHMSLRYDETGYFKVVVTPIYRGPFTYIFTGRVLGEGSNVIGGFELSGGSFRFPVMSRADRVAIEIQSDSHVPCRFLTAEWVASYNPKGRGT